MMFFKFDFSFTDEEIITYAKISGDVNPIHISEDYSQKHNLWEMYCSWILQHKYIFKSLRHSFIP